MLSAEEIAKNAPLMNEVQIAEAIHKLIKNTEEQMSVLLSEYDYEDYYSTAKEYWEAYDMPAKGNTKEIRECMWRAFEKAGVHNVHSKKEFLGFSKFLFKKLRVMDYLYHEMIG